VILVAGFSYPTQRAIGNRQLAVPTSMSRG
jgi:hypothetical protein